MRPFPKIMDTIQTDTMSENATKSGRGGARKGAGRRKNLQKRCWILAIAARLVVSESTARRLLREHGGRLKHLLTPETVKILDTEWNQFPEDQRLETYAYLRARVAENWAKGWTRK
jgi:hypothetical protein